MPITLETNVILTDEDGDVQWAGTIAEFLSHNKKEAFSEIFEDLTEDGAHFTGGGAAPIFQMALTA